jgi:2-octaprenyl-6-methoxyphenol hydroxylase
MSFDTDILIVGGGLNGTVLALALAQVGFESIVLDALPIDMRKGAAFDGRGYAIAQSSQRMLNALGVWDAVRMRASPF